MTELILECFFWSGILCFAHTYLFYPFLLKVLSRSKHNNAQVFQNPEAFPQVSVLMSVYNEAAVIGAKLNSLLHLDYPPEKLSIWIGSDCSSDTTNEVLASFTQNDPRIHFFPFAQRRGKPPVINELAENAIRAHSGASALHVFLITDANVILIPQTLKELVKHFKNERIAVVDAHMIHTGAKANGISQVEDQYISTEVQLKHREGIVWGKMIGPFGGCYAVRADYFTPVPHSFLVDDFFITLKAIERGGLAISELKAICYEPVSHEIGVEYRRKTRISSGNFQNMATFRRLWLPPWRSSLHFAFFSHKILRWTGPFLIIVAGLCCGLLALNPLNLFYRYSFFVLSAGCILLPLLDSVLARFGFHVRLLRSLRYFLLMNMALMEGFYNYLKGIKNNVWEPTKRQ
jgi:cellulose synthase/poly-beta-1,6-N-acetylglucosamine synthase-like glycosyltransferase